MSKVLWIFESTKQAKDHLLSKNIDLYEWDRIIILWSEQTTHEWTGKEWKNIFGIYVMWEKGDQWEKGDRGIPWKDWLNGKDGEKWDKWDRGDIWLRGEKWEDGVSPQLPDVVKNLCKKIFSNEVLLQQIKWEKGKDWSDGKNGIDGRDGKDGVDGKDWKNWLNWFDWSMIHIVDIFPNNWNRDEKDIVIDHQKNIYCYRNNTIVKI